MLAVKQALSAIMILINFITSLGISVESVTVDGYNEQVYTLVANPAIVSTEQRLSFNEVTGFETVDEMAQYGEVGVNGMFYNGFGRPSGLLVMDGDLIRSRSIGYPMFLIRDEGVAEFIEPQVSTYIRLNGADYWIERMNEGMLTGQISIFTTWYGPHTRQDRSYQVVEVRGNVVDKIYDAQASVLIPEDLNNVDQGNFMVCFNNLGFDFPVELGASLELVTIDNFDLDTVDEGFQTGGWIVKDGENVAYEYPAFFEGEDSMQPRTAIGITSDNKVVMMVVDGRNPGVSTGVTGKQLGQLLMDKGCINACYLDGGASSTMVNNQEVINRPSLGQAKAIAHAVYFFRELTIK